MKQSIFLMGFMASGKSTLGKKLAKKLELEFIETDALVENEVGMAVQTIFSEKGEAYFRELESRVLRQLDFTTNKVIALGGGTACSEDNLNFIQSKGLSIYFHLSIPDLIGRLRQNRIKRPLTSNLDDEEIAQLVNEKMTERAPYYEKATLVFDVHSGDINKLVKEIEKYSVF